jgi:hypothetical protein
MTRDEQAIFVTAVRWVINYLVNAGLMRPIKYGRSHPGVATEDVERAVAALERAALRHFQDGGETLARRLRRWVKAGCPAVGRSARRLRETPGGKLVFKAIRQAVK